MVRDGKRDNFQKICSSQSDCRWTSRENTSHESRPTSARILPTRQQVASDSAQVRLNDQTLVQPGGVDHDHKLFARINALGSRIAQYLVKIISRRVHWLACYYAADAADLTDQLFMLTTGSLNNQRTTSWMSDCFPVHNGNMPIYSMP